MLTHTNSQAVSPDRVVILGSKGFVASTTAKNLRNRCIPVCALGRGDIDLLQPGADILLQEVLQPNDSLMIVSALAPCKNGEMLGKNLSMINTVLRAMQKQPVSHVLYISSDAVYQDSMKPINELSFTAPNSLHGVMHLSRELMLKAEVSAPLAILRPTLIYGAHDPHNGYGPNRFARLAVKGEEIVLFGAGEERRDHIAVEDVAELAVNILLHKSTGVLNAVSGEVISFGKIAEFLVEKVGSKSKIRETVRIGAMPHNGYRAFSTQFIKQAFPAHSSRSVLSGLEAMIHSIAT